MCRSGCLKELFWQTRFVPMKSLTVLVPFYNESRTIEELVHQLKKLPNQAFVEAIFVDDGSTDNSLEILERVCAETELPNQIIKKRNGGKASAIYEGAKFLKTTHVVILDSDLELATSDITKLWEIVLKNNCDFVFGFRRFLSHSSFTYRYSRGNQLISNIYGLLFNELITDIMCGYKLVPSDLLKQLKFKYKRFGSEIEIPMNMWLSRSRAYEVEVSYQARSRAEGKSITVLDAFRIILSMVLFRITHRRQK